MPDFLYYGLHFRKGNHLCNIIQHKLTVFERAAAFVTVIGDYIFNGIRNTSLQQRLTLMSSLPALLKTARFA